MWGTDGHFSEEEMGWKYIQKSAQNRTAFLCVTVFFRLHGQGGKVQTIQSLIHAFTYFEGIE